MSIIVKTPFSARCKCAGVRVHIRSEMIYDCTTTDDFFSNAPLDFDGRKQLPKPLKTSGSVDVTKTTKPKTASYLCKRTLTM